MAAPPPPGAPSLAAPGATPRINLSFEALAGDAQRRAVASADEPALEAVLTPPPSGRRRSLDELRAESDRQSAAESNVRQGRAPPVLYDYLRDARTHLEAEATRLAEALPLGPSQTTKGWVRGYLGRAAEVNRREARDLPEAPDDDFGHRPDVLGGYREAEHQAASGAEERTAEVCLGIAPGHPVVVTLRRSSGHAALDQLALQSFEVARDKRPLDSDVRPGLACYTVRISAYRVPPLPSLGLGIKNGKPDLIYPLKRMTQITVELRSLDHGDRPASSSLLRAP